MFATYDQHNTFTAFESLADYLDEAHRLLQVTVKAISSMQGMGRLVEVLDKGPQRVAQAQELERLAMEEVKNGFPLLYAHSVVAVWSALEAAIPQFCADWLMCFPQLLENKPFAKVSIQASSVLIADKRILVEGIIQTLQQITQAPLKVGVGRFDVLLDAVGISVPTEEERRRTLFELSKVRNVIVHQGGKADNKFISECPWVNATLGQRVPIGPERYRSYMIAARSYAADVVVQARQVAQEWTAGAGSGR